MTRAEEEKDGRRQNSANTRGNMYAKAERKIYLDQGGMVLDEGDKEVGVRVTEMEGVSLIIERIRGRGSKQ